jgi:lipopolysaccharide transport system permease protein
MRKIYFPREIFPLTGVITKLVEFVINSFVLACLLLYFQIIPTATIVWLPPLVVYIILASLAFALSGAALNMFYRDVGTMLPILLQLLMYASPVIYPASLVKQKLLISHAAGQCSEFIYRFYTLNPMAGIIDAFQRAVTYGQLPDIDVMWPGMLFTALLLPVSYATFKRAERPGDEDHRAHFDYLLPAFSDRRYVSVNGKPMFLVYRPSALPDARLFFCAPASLVDGFYTSSGAHLIRH